ncbi:ankyrin repeat domain-containing protein [Bacteroidota bacterium]
MKDSSYIYWLTTEIIEELKTCDLKYKMKKIIITLCLLLIAFIGLIGQNIFSSISKGDIDEIKTILENKPGEINTKQGFLSPLFYAVRLGKNNVAKFLISKGAEMNEFASDINEFSPLEFTPITDAIRTNNIEIIKFMVENGADLQVKSSLGETYLHFAAHLNRTELIEYLINKGIDVNVKKNGNLTPLHIASVDGYIEVVKLLIDNGADLNFKSTDGGTALHFAEAADNKEIVDLLLASGAKNISRGFPIYKGKYLGLKSSGSTPIAFAPELFRDIYRPHSTPAFSPDGKEVFWEAMFMQGNNDAHRIWHMKEENGKWTSPKVAAFSKYPSGGPAFFHDGQKLVFHSLQPRDDSTTAAKDFDLWFVERKGNEWSEAQHLNTPLNKDKSFEVSPVVSKDGTIYLKVGGQELINKSALVDGVYQETEIIGDLFNTDYIDKNKDQEYFLFFSDNGKERYSFQMYISFHRPDGRWGKPIFLGDKIHQGKRNTQSIISFDDKYLFFTRYFSFYWIDSKIIDDLKPDELKR